MKIYQELTRVKWAVEDEIKLLYTCYTRCCCCDESFLFTNANVYCFQWKSFANAIDDEHFIIWSEESKVNMNIRDNAMQWVKIVISCVCDGAIEGKVRQSLMHARTLLNCIILRAFFTQISFHLFSITLKSFKTEISYKIILNWTGNCGLCFSWKFYYN